MKILSMTATFGKLTGQTLSLQPGMNIIEAPNEWGKSTWCAFLMAMLYGIDTGARTKAGFLADKEHYAPWSGAPMSGSMEILWQGREITIQRQNKGRVPFGEVKAFETHSGVSVPELAVAAPGQVLLGVEKSVFARAGFLKLSEMPVTEDESLRRRLNELVTTGDESGASDDLAQKLKDLKNKCRFNKKGLLPELEQQKADLQQKLQQLDTLQYQISAIARQQADLQEQTRLLENHKQALDYAEQLDYAQKLAAAKVSRDTAEQSFQQAQEACQALPSREKIQEDLALLQQLRETRDALHTKAQLLPPLPQPPVAQEPFRGMNPETAVAQAAQDRAQLEKLNKAKNPIAYIVGAILLAVGAALLFFLPIAGVVALVAGVGAILLGVTQQSKLKQQISALTDRYRGSSPDYWESAAAAYANSQREYTQTVNTRQQTLADIHTALEENTAAVNRLTGGQGITQFEQLCREHLQAFVRLQEQQRALAQAEQVLQALSVAGKQVAPPQFADELTFSLQETQRRLSENAVQKQLLHQRLGQCQGQMETLGQAQSLQQQLQQLQLRIDRLETYYCALTRAQETLQQATQELQRRFAPRISQRAQELFARLTGERYQRLTLGQDLSVEASAQDENTLRGTLWRSDGTVDQLYLALRLAVAEELTPTAPLVLDDALVRFDDTRLAAALSLLEQTADEKQVILFTCQSREKHISDSLA